MIQVSQSRMGSGLFAAMVAVAAVMAIGMSGCAAKAIRPGAERVIVSRQSAPKTCKFKGQVLGEQGGAIWGGLTSNKNLALGAMNDIRNNAMELGANYVVLEDSRAGQTITGSGSNGFSSASGQQTDVTQVGNAYLCPAGEIGLE